MTRITRSGVSFFMNRWAFIEYNGRIRVYKSLLNMVIYDQLLEQNAVKPSVKSSRD